MIRLKDYIYMTKKEMLFAVAIALLVALLLLSRPRPAATPDTSVNERSRTSSSTNAMSTSNVHGVIYISTETKDGTPLIWTSDMDPALLSPSSYLRQNTVETDIKSQEIISTGL